jgi:hypothetical protein
LPTEKNQANFDFGVLTLDALPDGSLDLGGTVRSLVWGREATSENAQRFLNIIDCDWLVTGHIPQETGYLWASERHLILRTSWVVSAHGSNFVKTMLRLGGTRDSLAVVADQIGGPTPGADIADALLVAAKAMVDGAHGGTHHFAGAPDVSWAGFARAIIDGAPGVRRRVWEARDSPLEQRKIVSHRRFSDHKLLNAEPVQGD